MAFIISNINIDKDKPVLTFWKDSLNILKGDDTLTYPEINHIVTGLLSLPHSSAYIEKVFSAVNIKKYVYINLNIIY